MNRFTTSNDEQTATLILDGKVTALKTVENTEPSCTKCIMSGGVCDHFTFSNLKCCGPDRNDSRDIEWVVV